MYPTPPTTWSGRSRHAGSSGDDSSASTGSRIDSNDPFRVGGPGPLPVWPLETGSPQHISAQLAERLVNLAILHLERFSLGDIYHRITVVQRYCKKHTPTPRDNTLLISLYPSSNSNWVIVLHEMISACAEIGFTGRIEMIDHRALDGMKSFPPEVSPQLAQDWIDIQQLVARRLSSLNADWKVVMLAKRGYWKDVAVNTVLIKVSLPSHTAAISTRDSIALTIGDFMDRHNLQVEVARADYLWGLFSTEFAGDPMATSLSSSFINSWNFMGLSVGRADGAGTGTIGGYLKFLDSRGHGQVLGLTCYHVIRALPGGDLDPTIPTTGSVNIKIPCQSPSKADLDQEVHLAMAKVPKVAGLASPFYQEHLKKLVEQRDQRLREISSFNTKIGACVATSGWRNTDLNPSFTSPSILQDWALVHVKNGRMSNNFIADIVEIHPTWKPESAWVTKIARIPNTEAPVVKRGRATGITLGWISGLVPARFRIEGYPGGLHHRGWGVFNPSTHFAKPGDSGSWVLDMSGRVVAIVIAGDSSDGSTLALPMTELVKDAEIMVKLPAGAFQVDMTIPTTRP
ncbi:hypothetical protein MferCBS31731_007956 [Microsporum ferrugineum]